VPHFGVNDALDRSGSVSSTVRVIRTSTKDYRLIVWPGLLLALLTLLYADVLKGLILQWWSDPDYGHGFFVPLFSCYILWRNRARWTKSEIKPSNFGFVVMLGAVGLLLLGSLGAELFISRFSLLLLVAGMILFLAGWNALGAVSFPLSYLIWMIPIPVIVFNQIAFPLQLVASRLATAWLELLSVPVLRDGNVLVMSNYSLEVMEACSGIRSLMTLIALAIAYGYLSEPRLSLRYILALMMIPIAIVTNAIRIVAAGMLAHRYGPAAAEGLLHGFSGWFIFVSALALMFLCHWIMRRMTKTQRDATHV